MVHDTWVIHGHKTERITCDITEMPTVVAKLVDYGISVRVYNLYNDDGGISDNVRINVDAERDEIDRALARTPMWYPVTLS
jgi:hypothetical protein